MKRVLLLILGIFFLFVLGACSGEGSSNVQQSKTQNIDGKYVEITKVDGKVKVLSDWYFEIDGNVLTEDDGEMFSIDLEKQQVLDNESGGVKPYKINEKFDVITYNGNQYIKVGGKGWKDLLEKDPTISE